MKIGRVYQSLLILATLMAIALPGFSQVQTDTLHTDTINEFPHPDEGALPSPRFRPDTILTKVLPDTSSVPLLDVVSIYSPMIPYQVLNEVRFSREKLARFQSLALGDLLATIPAVFVKSYGQAGSSTPAFRGTGAGHTQVYWNGLPMNAPTLGLTDLSLSSPGLFDDIRVFFGSLSLRLGSGGLGGAIQLRNHPFGLQEGFRFSQEYGSFGTTRTLAGGTWRKGKFYSDTRVLYNQSQNDFTFRNSALIDSPRDTLEHSKVQQLGLSQVLGIGDFKNHVEARIWLNGLDRELPPTMLTNNLTESQSDRSLRSQIHWKKRTENDWVFLSTVGYSLDRLTYENLQANILSNTEVHQGQLLFEAKDERSKKWLPRMKENSYQVQANIAQARSDGFAQAHEQSQVHAAISQQYLLSPVMLQVLLRSSYIDGEFTLPYGSIGLSTSKPKSLLSLNLSRNIRFPTLNDRYWDPGGNPDLETETSWSIEAGWQKRIHLLFPMRELLVQVQAYASWIDNWIQWIPSATSTFWSPENVQRVLTRGGEVRLEYQGVFHKLDYHLQANYALSLSQAIEATGNQNASLNRQLIYTPRHSGRLNARAEYKNAWLFYAQDFTGIRYTSTDHSSSLPAFSLGEIRMGYRFKGLNHYPRQGHKLELYAGIRNLWNVDYQTIAWRPMPGRNYFLGCRLHLNRQKP